MLNFIGTGGAFNIELGNNSAYLKMREDTNNIMYLIDCGSSVFSDIVLNNLLDDVDRLYVIITHLHPDHVGSLGDLIFYCHFYKKIEVSLVHPDFNQLEKLLNMQGVTNKYYNPWISEHIDIGSFLVSFIENSHVEEIPSYGLIIRVVTEKDYTVAYYSGDTNYIRDDILTAILNNQFKYIYHDTCGAEYPGNVHTPLSKLIKEIPSHLHSKVFCMHLDNAFSRELALNAGFNVVTNIYGK